jgi:DNA-binding HxlR family transcriptional regulator
MSVTILQAEVTDFEMIRGTRQVLDVLAGKWNIGVLYLLASGTKRYSELFYEVGEVPKKTLTQTLRGLERDGLVTRRVYPQVPAKVEYSLTSLGWSITTLLMEMYEWSASHADEVEAARAAFEGAGSKPVPSLRLAA